MDPWSHSAGRSHDPLARPIKSFWREERKDVWTFFCPHCRVERRLPFHPRPGRLRHYIQVGITSAFFTLLTWHWFSWRGVVSFLPFWAFFEVFYRSRVRASLSCPHCGFDPFLYLVDVQKARQEVENHWRKKFAEKGIPYPEKKTTRPSAPASNPALTETTAGR